MKRAERIALIAHELHELYPVAVRRAAARLEFALLEHRHRYARTDRVTRAALALERALYRHARPTWRAMAAAHGFRKPREK